MIGMHGTYRANMSTGACDLLIAVGVRFDDRVTGKIDAFAPPGPTCPPEHVTSSLPWVCVLMTG